MQNSTEKWRPATNVRASRKKRLSSLAPDEPSRCSTPAIPAAVLVPQNLPTWRCGGCPREGRGLSRAANEAPRTLG